MSWFSGGISNIVSSVGQTIQKVTTPAADLAEKVASNKTLNTALPLTALYTGKGRENLVNGVWGKFGQGVASIYTGGRSDGLAAAIQQQVNGSDGTAGPEAPTTPDPIGTSQWPTSPGGYYDGGGSYVGAAPAAATSAGSTWWKWGAIGGGVLLFVIVLIFAFRGRRG